MPSQNGSAAVAEFSGAPVDKADVYARTRDHEAWQLMVGAAAAARMALQVWSTVTSRPGLSSLTGTGIETVANEIDGLLALAPRPLRDHLGLVAEMRERAAAAWERARALAAKDTDPERAAWLWRARCAALAVIDATRVVGLVVDPIDGTWLPKDELPLSDPATTGQALAVAPLLVAHSVMNMAAAVAGPELLDKPPTSRAAAESTRAVAAWWSEVQRRLRVPPKA